MECRADHGSVACPGGVCEGAVPGAVAFALLKRVSVILGVTEYTVSAINQAVALAIVHDAEIDRERGER